MVRALCLLGVGWQKAARSEGAGCFVLFNSLSFTYHLWPVAAALGGTDRHTHPQRHTGPSPANYPWKESKVSVRFVGLGGGRWGSTL